MSDEAEREGLVLAGIDITLGPRRLLALDRRIPPGEILSVMGPSGSGKSTLLAFLGGFLDPAFTARGTVRLGGRDVTQLAAESRRIGLLFQDALLFPHMSVGGNVVFALPRALSGRAARRAGAEALLGAVDLPGVFERDPATLSGGEAARVALARTLAAEPQALLLDEPFSRLDRALRAEIRALVFDLVRRRAIPAILATHDEADVQAAGGPLVALDGGRTVDRPA